MSRFKIRHDPVKGEKWYHIKTLPFQNRFVTLNICENTDTGKFRMTFDINVSFSRSGKSDISTVNLIFRVDKNVVEIPNVPWECHTSYSYKYGTCTYSFSIELDYPDREELVRSIINSELAIVRIDAGPVTNDLTISKGEKNRLREVLSYFENL